MTTVAFKRAVLAADTRATTDDMVEPGHFRKVFRFSNGALLGLAGDVPDIQGMVREIRKDPDKKITFKPKSSLEAILVKTDGSVTQLDEAGWAECEDAEFYAIGSGRLPALVAMRCGKSAIEAVKIAMEFDRNTGGKVQSVRRKR